MIKSEKINFVSNKIKLNAYFYSGLGKEKKPTLIWLHGIPGGREDGKAEISKKLNKAGINVLKFNYQGIWGNKGEFILENALKDLSTAIDFLTKKENTEKFKIDKNRIVLFGYSYGTAVALTGALSDERIKNIICLAVCDYSYFGREFMDPHSGIREFLEDAVEGVFSKKEYFKQDPRLFLNNLSYNISRYDIVRHAEKLKSKKILMICGSDDNICPVEDHLLPLYRKLREYGHENLKLEINNCGHEPPPDLAEKITGWINNNV